jgi:hypothetical protein
MSSLQDSSPVVRNRSINTPTLPDSRSGSPANGESVFGRVLDAAFLRVDNAGVTFFRIAFGCLMAAWAWNYLSSGRVTRLYIEPSFNFTYYGFDWVEPLPGNGMYLHFVAIMVLSLMIAAGFLYRLASCGFAIAMIYVFLLDRTNYQNHYYLICLFGCLLPLLPLNRNVSVDAWRKPAILTQTTSAWVYWVIRFHVGVPYFFGGIAKLTPDWLLGQPMGLFLSTKTSIPVIGSLVSLPSTGLAMSWMGLLFDLLIVPALLWRKTRVAAYIFCIAFHLMNAVLFNIHVFPWFMIVATTIFFDPAWPRRLLTVGQGTKSVEDTDNSAQDRRQRPAKWVVAIVSAYVLFHFLWPLRSRLYGNEPSWDERGHLFSWRMMLRAKEVGLGYAIVDPETGRVANVDHKQFIDAEQSEKFGRDPELILFMAHFIANRFESEMGRRPQVYAFVLASLNGRKAQLMIDPNVDLAAEPRGQLGKRDWVMPLTEPLRREPWIVPVEQWRQYVELPEIEFLKKAPAETPS